MLKILSLRMMAILVAGMLLIGSPAAAVITSTLTLNTAAPQVCSTLSFTACYTFDANEPAVWTGLSLAIASPAGFSSATVTAVNVNGSPYAGFGTSFPLSLNYLEGSAPAPNTGAQLCVTFTITANNIASSQSVTATLSGASAAAPSASFTLAAPNFSGGNFSVSTNTWTTSGGQTTVTISNSGTDAVFEQLSVQLPTGYVFDDTGSCSLTRSSGGTLTCIPDGGSDKPIWSAAGTGLPSILTGETITLVFYAKMNGSTYCDTQPTSNNGSDPDVTVPSGNITAELDYRVSCGDQSNQSRTISVNPIEPDLDISITAAQELVAPTEDAEGTVTITNDGSATAAVNDLDLGNKLTLQFGAGLTNPRYNLGGGYESTGCSGNTCAVELNEDILPGANKVVPIIATVLESGSLNVTATIEGKCQDQDGDDICNHSLDSASKTFGYLAPTISKTLSNPKSRHPIGDTLNYQLTVAVPPTGFNKFIVTDELPAGMSPTGTPTVALGAGMSSSGVVVGYTGNKITINFGVLTVTTAGNIVITHSGKVDNIIGNQINIPLSDGTGTSAAELTYADPDSGSDVKVKPDETEPAVVVGEPNLTVTRSITAGAVGSESGDTVSWQVQVMNAGNPGNTTAYQMTWQDVLPAGLFRISNQALTTSGSVFLNGTTNPLASGNLSVTTTTNNKDTISLPSFQMAPGATLTITYDSEVMQTVTPGQVLSTRSRVSYTSLSNGGRNNSSGPGTVDDDVGNDSVLNNYEDGSGNVSLTVGSRVAVSMSIGNAEDSYLIGDDVSYRIRVSLIHGTTVNLNVFDTLPVGLTYQGHTISTGNAGITFGNADYNTRLGTGEDVSFNLGDVINPANGFNDDDYIDIVITARVANTSGNQNGTELKNGEAADGSEVYITYGLESTRVDFDNDAGVAGNQGITITVIEPELNIVKTVTRSQQSLGDEVTVTVTVSHVAGSSADAYGIEVIDVLPDGLTYVPGSCSLPAPDVTEADPAFTFRKALLASGETLQFTYTATVDDTATTGTGLTIPSTMTWTNAVAGRTGDDCPTGVNDYCDTASVTVTPTAASFIGAVKTISIFAGGADGLLDPSDVAQYTVVVTNNGTETATGVVFTDTIPEHTSYVSGSLGATKGTAEYNAGDGTITVTIGDLEAGGSKAVTITFRVRVDDDTLKGTVISNQGVVDSEVTVAVLTDNDANAANGKQATTAIVSDRDSDGDGTIDSLDGCPNDAYKVDPGICGCGVPEADCEQPGQDTETGTPVIYSPVNTAVGVSLTPELGVGYEAGVNTSVHSQTRWQIATDAQFYNLVLDRTTNGQSVRMVVPAMVLEPDTGYYWRVRYYDSSVGGWSWYTVARFWTGSLSETDANVNGVPDSQEVGPDEDINGDGIYDLDQPTLLCATGGFGNGFCVDLDDQTGIINRFKWLSPSDVPRPSNVSFNHGLLSFRLTVSAPGEEIYVYLSPENGLDGGYRWLLYDAVAGWSDYSGRLFDSDSLAQSRGSLALLVQDGGAGDTDGVANGVIAHTSGPGYEFDEGTVSSGCFIDTLLSDTGNN